MMEKDLLIEKVSKILGKSVNEVAFNMPVTKQMEALVEKMEGYEKTLKFYANEENYEEWDKDLDLISYIHTVDFDGGDNARKVLGIKDND